MSLADPSDILGTLAQIQFINQSGAFSVPMRMKWLPASVAGATPDDVKATFDNLKAILKVDLGKISLGGDIPEEVDRQLACFDKAVVRLRLAKEDWKQKMAEELLTPLLQELGEFAGFARADSGDGECLTGEYAAPTWLKLYRAVHTHDVDFQHLREVTDLICGGQSHDENAALAALTLVGHLSDSEDLSHLLRTMTRAQDEYPGCWDLLWSAELGKRLQCYAQPEQRCQLFYSLVSVIGEQGANSTKRAKLVRGLFAGIPDDEAFHAVICKLALLVRRSPGIEPEIQSLFTKQRLAEIPDLMTCLCPSARAVASNDAQFIIGRVLAKNQIAGNKVFRSFCKRTAGLEMSTNLRGDFAERVLDNRELLRSLLQRNLDLQPIQRQLRAASTPRQQLLCLLLIAVQLFEGEDLREVSRSLSLIDVAIRQNKIDSRHLDLLMTDLCEHPSDALACMADESQLDERLSNNKDLSLLYLTLRLTSQTANKVDGLDIDHLSGTLRKIRAHDRRR